MELNYFVYKIISDIEGSLDRINKNSNKDEGVIKSDINFDLYVEPKKDRILVCDAKTIKNTKATLNKIKFTIKYSAKTMAQILDKLQKDKSAN